MNKVVILDHSDIKNYTLQVIRQLTVSGWSPEYVVGVNEHGIIPAILISQYLEIPVYSIAMNDGDRESNAWMAEDALGHTTDKTNILIIEGYHDTDERVEWIKTDWSCGCLPSNPEWNNVWGGNVRFAALVNNVNCKEGVQYFAAEITDSDQITDIEFPHENWWMK